MLKKISILILVFLCASCSFTNLIINGKGDLKLKQVSFEELPGWKKDQQNKAVISFVNSCDQIAKMPANKQLGGKVGNIIAADFIDVCDIARVIKTMDDKQARNFFENWFVPFEITSDSSSGDENNQGLFTGYYVPELMGNKVKSDAYKYPVYAKPKDAEDLDLTRDEIDNGALDNKGLELLYVNDPIDLFFMHVQGSGRIILDNGSVVRLGFAGKNNHSYSSIGKYIIDNNLLGQETPSYFAIKNWLKTHPNDAKKIMAVNQSYVFFKISNNDEVIGSQGASLTAERSLAIDSDIMPLGFPIWLDINQANPYQKLVVSQDTGSAIKGAVRGDIFFGRGKSAEEKAAKMNYKGRYYILLPTSTVDRMAGR